MDRGRLARSSRKGDRDGRGPTCCSPLSRLDFSASTPMYASASSDRASGGSQDGASRASSRAGTIGVPQLDFANLTERARGLLQAAQMEALAGRHQNLLPEHLLKALIEDPEGLAGHLVRDAGGDPELLRTAAEERLERLPKATGPDSKQGGPHPIFMSPELAAVLRHASEAARAGGDRFVTAERLLASLAAQGPLRALFKRAGLDPSALAEAVERMRQGRKADAPSAEQNWEALAKYARGLTEGARQG